MKTYNQFLETPFSEEVKPPEPPQEEDPAIKSKEKRQKQIKKMVLLKKLQAVRAGAGADIVAGYEPEGEVIDETNWEIHKLKTRYGDKSKLSKSSWYNQRRSKNPDLRQSKKEFRKSVEDDAAHEKKMGRSKPTPSNLKDSLKKQSKVKKVDEGLGAAYAVGGVSNAIASVAKAWGASQAAKGAIIGGALSGGGAVVGGALNYAASRNKKSDSKKKQVKEETTFKRASRMVSEDRDQAFKNVVARLQKKHGKDSVITKDNPPKPPTEAQKKAYAAHKAKIAAQDTRDELEKSSDGRYSLRHSNRGSD